MEEDKNGYCIKVEMQKWNEYEQHYDVNFTFPAFLLNCDDEKYSDYMKGIREYSERRDRERKEKQVKERELREFESMAKNLIESQNYFKDPEKAAQLEKWLMNRGCS